MLSNIEQRRRIRREDDSRTDRHLVKLVANKSLGILKFSIRRSTFYQFFRRSHSRVPVETGASSVVSREAREGEGLIRCAFPLIWTSALDQAAGGSAATWEGTRGPSLRDVWRGTRWVMNVYTRLIHLLPYSVTSKTGGTSCQNLFTERSFFTFNARFCAKIQIALFPRSVRDTFPEKDARWGNANIRADFTLARNCSIK